MITFVFNNIKIKIQIFFVALITIFLMLDTTGIGTLSVMCSGLHELSHIVTSFILGSPPRELSFEFSGVRLVKSPLSSGKELLVLIAGSGFNFILALLDFWLCGGGISLFFLVNMSIGLINIIPVKGFDGGEIVLILLSFIFPIEKSERVFYILENIFIISILAGAVFFYLRGIVNISVAVLCVYMIFCVYF